MPNGDDHDLLTKLTEKIDGLVGVVVKFEQNNSEDHLLIFDKIDVNQKNVYDNMLTIHKEKVPWGNFKWIMSGICSLIFVSLVVIGGFTMETKTRVDEVAHMLEDHIYYAGAIYKKVTGKDWSDQSRLSLQEAKEAFLKSQKDKEERLK